MVSKTVVTICISVSVLFAPLTGTSAQPLEQSERSQQLRQFDLQAAFSRVPMGEWATISFTDLTTTMNDLGEIWTPPQGALLSERQEQGWMGVWRPDIFSLELGTDGFSPYNVEQIVEARQGNSYVLWLEGEFAVNDIGRSLITLGYEQIGDFPAEAYHASTEDKWERYIPYISLPDGHTVLIASSLDNLQAVLNVYDGLAKPISADDGLIKWLGDLSEGVTSGIVRLDQTAQGCGAANSRMVVHGLRYQDEHWQYVMNIAYAEGSTVGDVRPLSEGLEFSTFHVPAYGGVLGQHTHITEQNVYENNEGSIVQFVTDLRPYPDIQHLPFVLASQRDTCVLFETPEASAVSLALSYLPDLSAGRLDMDVHFGNAEQALYNAGINNLQTSDLAFDLSEVQLASLNSTWRTTLAYEDQFEEWFGFSADHIWQTVELSAAQNEYSRVVWGDFTTQDVEVALQNTGYVAVEQYGGTRVFTLRQATTSGGFLLGSLAQTVASPEDGVVVFANQVPNMRLTLDIVSRTFQSPLLRSRELLLTARALGDATNATLRRYVNPLSGGLVCGLPPYKVESFANVLRPDGWHFFYVVAANRHWDNADVIGEQLGEVLEWSDYPLQGPGSETFGELSSVVNVQLTQETDVTVVLVDLLVSGTEQQASFFGQDLATATLPPCALGDLTE